MIDPGFWVSPKSSDLCSYEKRKREIGDIQTEEEKTEGKTEAEIRTMHLNPRNANDCQQLEEEKLGRGMW